MLRGFDSVETASKVSMIDSQIEHVLWIILCWLVDLLCVCIELKVSCGLVRSVQVHHYRQSSAICK